MCLPLDIVLLWQIGDRLRDLVELERRECPLLCRSEPERERDLSRRRPSVTVCRRDEDEEVDDFVLLTSRLTERDKVRR